MKPLWDIKRSHISGHSALFLLEHWMEGEFELLEDEYEWLFDRVLATLEESRNHRYRFELARRLAERSVREKLK